MSRALRRGLKAAILSAVLLACSLAAAPAFAASPTLSVTAFTKNPTQNHVVRVDVRLFKGTQPVKNTAVSFVWSIDGATYKASAKTSAKGLAHVSRKLGAVKYWRMDKVTITAKVSGKKLSAVYHFQPLPMFTLSSPVTVRIGIAGPLTAGATALGQGMQRGATLAIEQANASSTVSALGIRFAGIVGDDQGDPKTAVSVAKYFVGDPRMLGVEGHLNSGCSIPASKIYSNAIVPMVTPASTNPALTLQGLHNVFRTCTTDDWQGIVAGAVAYSLGSRKAYVVDDSTPYGEGLATNFTQGFTTAGGTIVDAVHTSDRDTDFTELVAEIKSSGADMVYYGGIYNAGSVLASQLSVAGLPGELMGGDGLYDPKFISLGGAAETSGDVASSVGYPVDHLPNGSGFLSAYASRYSGTNPMDYDAYAYDATNVILSAIVAEAQTHGTAFLGVNANKHSIISRIQATETTGTTGPISFDAHGDRNQRDVAFYAVTGGGWTYQGTW